MHQLRAPRYELKAVRWNVTGSGYRVPGTGFRNPAYRTRSHLGFCSVDKRHWPQHSRGVGERDSERHRVADDPSGERRRMSDPAIDRVCIDVVSAARLEGSIRIGVDRTDGIAECAADVDVDIGAVDDQPG